MIAVGPVAWAPLRHRVFRALWTAQFAANIGVWAQLVAAQWLMGDLGGGTFAVALVQTAATLPVFLLVVPAGALGDIIDRRRLLLVGQLLALSGSASLALVSAAGAARPVVLLALVALTGVGQALSVPSFQAIQAELVPLAELPQAALLNGANANVGRALGPALGGIMIAAAGPAAAFALNALCFLGVAVVLAAWRRAPDVRPLGAERLLGAVRAGTRYVRNAPRYGAVLLRLALFMVFGGALWALLPEVARGPLGLGPEGYGLLLAGVGLGAVLGALVVPLLREQVAPDPVLIGGTLLYAGATLVVGLAPSVLAVAAVLVLGGLGWVVVQSTLNAAAQVALPAWTRARALAWFQLGYMGGQAVGGLAWGAVAELAGLRVGLLAPAAGLVAGVLLATRLPRIAPAPPDLRPARHLPDPPDVPGTGRLGPVLVTVEWRVAPPDAPEFTAAMHEVGAARRRTGARRWGLFRDAENPECFLEAFIVATWSEHLRQHLERGTEADRALEDHARSLLLPGTVPHVRHLLRGA